MSGVSSRSTNGPQSAEHGVTPEARELRIVDLFCGIGGVAEATRKWSESAADRTVMPRVVSAIDIDQRIGSIYEVNHDVRPNIGTIESMREVPNGEAKPPTSEGCERVFARTSMQMWWMSPPCQPYTARGKQLAEADPRSAGFERILDLLPSQSPEFVGLENVPAFQDSAHHRRLKTVLTSAGYDVKGYQLCPTQWGVPMRRRRFYFLARRNGTLPSEPRTSTVAMCLQEHLEPHAWDDGSLHVDPITVANYSEAMNVLDIQDANAVASCFTSAYGKSPVRAGSYLRCPQRNLVRRFSPNEIASLLGFRRDFHWTPNLSQRAKYQLLGNSLAVTVVRDLLKTLVCGSIRSGD